MRMQELFNKITAHLLKQGEKSILSGSDRENPDSPLCRYRSTNEKGAVLKCAVGILIPDELYHTSIEYRSARNKEVAESAGLHYDAVDYRGMCSGPEIDLAVSLQQIHDNKPVTDWPFEFARIAKMFRLNNGN